MRGLLKELENQLALGNDMELVSVIASSGSTPRGSGARMLVTAQGRQYGTIGGGAVEYNAEKIALALLKEKASHTKQYALAPNEVEDLGMVCGGGVTVFFQYISGASPAAKRLCQRGLEAFSKAEPSWLVTELTDEQQWQMGIYAKKEALAGMEKLPEAVLASFSAKAVLKEFDGKKFYIEPLVQSGFVYIFGGGHVAQELTPFLSKTGFQCVIFEDRPEFATAKLFPEAVNIVLGDFTNFGDKINVGQDDYIIIMTRGHKHDYEVQRQAMKTNACYIGVIGSKNKIRFVSEKLLLDGFTKEEIQRIYTPIGIDILSETPAEIAVSITAQLIKVRGERMRA